MTAPLIRIEEFAVSLGKRPVVAPLDLSIRAGELVAIVGPNGAGKTTLVRAMAGLIPSTGRIALGGVPMSEVPAKARARRVGYLPQGHVFHWPLPVIDVVALGRLPHGAGAGELGRDDLLAVERAMAATGTTDFADRPVTTLSGGERARVALARVLAGEPDVVLADEPIASLDPHYQLQVLGLLRARADAGSAIVAVLHDLTLAARFADRILVLSKGRLAALGPSDVLTPKLLADVFAIEASVERHDGRLVITPIAAI